MTSIQSYRVLVTGANGFIGMLLCKEMLRQGLQVRGATRSSTQIPVEDMEIVTIGNIDGDTNWTSALSGVDTVVHLAARVHVMQETITDPLAEFLKVNLQGTKNLAQQSARNGIKRFVYISSIKVNGEETHDQHSYTEQDIPKPQEAYGKSKWEAEQALHRIAEDTGLETVIMRPPLVYGPGVKGNFLHLLKAINRGIPLPLAGACNTRDMIYVGNLVNAIITCALHPKAARQTYLVRDGEEISTALLVKMISTALGQKNRMFHVPTPLLRTAATVLGRSKQIDRLFGSLRLSDKKIRRELEWIPPYSQEYGLNETVTWYQQHQNSTI